MTYKIVMMDGENIPIESEEALQRFLEEANAGKKLIITSFGIVNVASVSSIVPHRELNESINEKLRMREMLPDGTSQPQFTPDQAIRDTLGSSPFAKLLGEKMKMLSPQSRTKAQEQAARDERRTK